jgi:ZIP family zinc transporter
MSVPVVTFRSKGFLVGAAVASALAEPAGAVLGLLAIGARPCLASYFLAFAAGAMIFVSVHELLPMAQRYGRKGGILLGLLIGVCVHSLLALVIGG